MKYRTRIYYTEEQKAVMWDRWQKARFFILPLEKFNYNQV
jgi:hypothetical protein